MTRSTTIRPDRCLRGVAATLAGALLFAAAGADSLDAQRAYPPEMEGTTSEVYRTVGDVALNIYLCNPEGHSADDSRPAIVFFFGGGWRGGSPQQFLPHCRYLAERGMVAAVADYRVASRHGVTAHECVADAKSAVRWLRSNAARLGIDPDRIAAGGGSAGGHLAAATAVLPGHDPDPDGPSPVPNALVLFNPATVLAPVEGDPPPTEEQRERFEALGERFGAPPESMSPYHHLREGLPPTILFHGDADETVPHSTADRFCLGLREHGARCDFVSYHGQGHGFFNFGRGEGEDRNKWYEDTVSRMDSFLGSLDWLGPKPNPDGTPGKRLTWQESLSEALGNQRLPAVVEEIKEKLEAEARAAAAAEDAGEWHNYAADSRSSKYSPLDRIDRTNVHRLEVAWRWKSIDYGLAARHEGVVPPFVFQNTPMMRDGRVLVATGLGAAALDPASGEILWTYDPFEDEQPRNMGRGSVRGGVTWNDGERRRLFFTGNGRLTALDADTGALDPDFGDGGRADMLDVGSGATRRQYFWTSAPVVCGDTIVVGESTADAWSRRKNPPGMIRGYDARSGALRWRFNIVPEPGEFGFDTWDSPEAAEAGAANVWTWISCDQELGMAYAATSTPSNDWYGGHRPGMGLFAESILALDAGTGERRWHFQAVHHGLWDYDFPAAPVLADIVVDGKPIKALAQPSKQAFLYVFDRETGEPVWPIVELPVPPSEVPGERAWPTQPHPTWPLPYDLQGLAIDDLIDFTPELRAMAIEYVSRYRIGPIFQPPTLMDGPDARPTIQVPGAVGGTNWNGAALDPETNVIYLPSVTVPAILGLRPPPDPARSNLRYRVDLSEADGYAWTTLPNGLPITKPPYGRLTAIDLDTGEHLWMVPNGDGPRDHPALAHLDLPPLGQQGRVSALVTKTLVFLADGSDAMVVQPEGAGSRMFRAYDKANGEVVGEIELPAGVSGAPMTYLHEGRQYIVMAIGGVGFEGELLALALPEEPGTAAAR